MHVTNISFKTDECPSSPGESEFALAISGIVLDEEMATFGLMRHDQAAFLATILNTMLASVSPDSPTSGSSQSGQRLVRLWLRVAQADAPPYVVVIEQRQATQVVVEYRDDYGDPVHVPLVLMAT